MSRVVFLCGAAGSGKTTLARRLESEGMTRLSFDSVAWARGERSMPLAPAVHAAIASELERRLAELVDAGCDVVLDFAFASRETRAYWLGLLDRRNSVAELIHLTTPRDLALARLQHRHGAHADDFVLDEATARRYHDYFEPPTEDEGFDLLRRIG